MSIPVLFCIHWLWTPGTWPHISRETYQYRVLPNGLVLHPYIYKTCPRLTLYGNFTKSCPQILETLGLLCQQQAMGQTKFLISQLLEWKSIMRWTTLTENRVVTIIKAVRILWVATNQPYIDMDIDSSSHSGKNGFGIEKAESEKKMRAAYIIREWMCSIAASLYPEIGKSSRRWYSSFGTFMAKPKSVCSHRTIHCLVFSVQSFGIKYVGAWLAKSTDACFATTVTFIDDTATHSRDYANSIADSPILAKQTMILPVRNWTSVSMTHHDRPFVCCTADHSLWNYGYGPWEEPQHTLKCMCWLYPLFVFVFFPQ